MRAGRLIFCALLAAAPAAAADEATDIVAARTFAEQAVAASCRLAKTDDDHAYRVKYRTRWQDQDSPDEALTLVQLHCATVPGKRSSVFVARHVTGGSSLLSFAEPVLDYDYADEAFTRLKAPPTVSGYAARNDLMNATFDPGAKTIKATAHWQGREDAWSAGEWTLADGTFVLVRYEVDPTFDGGEGGIEPKSYVVFEAEGR